MENEDSGAALLDAEDDEYTPSTVRFSCEPVQHPTTLKTLLREYLQDGNTDLAPDYQRSNAWKPQQFSRLVDSIMARFPIPSITVISLPPGSGPYEYEVADGAHRMRCIAAFMTGTPVLSPAQGHRTTLFVTWPRAEADGSVVHVLYTLTPEAKAWAGGRMQLRAMTPEEKYQFDKRSLNIAMITDAITPEMRREMFVRLCNGSNISAAERMKNVDNPFCRAVLTRRWKLRLLPFLERALHAKFAPEQWNWLTLMARMVLLAADAPTPMNFLASGSSLRDRLERVKPPPAPGDVLADPAAVAQAADLVEAFLEAANGGVPGASGWRGDLSPLQLLGLLSAFRQASATGRAAFRHVAVWEAVHAAQQAAAAAEPALARRGRRPAARPRPNDAGGLDNLSADRSPAAMGDMVRYAHLVRQAVETRGAEERERLSTLRSQLTAEVLDVIAPRAAAAVEEAAAAAATASAATASAAPPRRPTLPKDLRDFAAGVEQALRAGTRHGALLLLRHGGDAAEPVRGGPRAGVEPRRRRHGGQPEARVRVLQPLHGRPPHARVRGGTLARHLAAAARGGGPCRNMKASLRGAQVPSGTAK